MTAVVCKILQMLLFGLYLYICCPGLVFYVYLRLHSHTGGQVAVGVINPADEDGLWFVFTYVRRDCALCAWFVSLSVLSSFPYPVGGIRLLVVRA